MPGSQGDAIPAPNGSGNEHGCAAHVSAAQPVERLVGLAEREHLDFRVNARPWRESKELLAVPAREVRNRPNGALTPQQLVREGRNVGHVDPGAHNDPALAHSSQGGRDELAGRREDDRRVELLRHLVDSARPRRSELQREGLRCLVAGSRQREYAPPLPHRDLAENVRCRAEPVEADGRRVAHEPAGWEWTTHRPRHVPAGTLACKAGALARSAPSSRERNTAASLATGKSQSACRAAIHWRPRRPPPGTTKWTCG